jgi:sugar lactone lactonase YvrE
MDKPELVFFAGSTLLEGPVWDALNKNIACVSIEQSCIYLINTETGMINTIKTNGQVGCAVNKGANIYWSAEKMGIYEINIMTGERTFLVHPESNLEMRYNDGKLDPFGRFLFGTMGFDKEMPLKGRLFSFDGQNCNVIIEGITISNGIAFSQDGSIMYFIDTPTRAVKQYDYNKQTGEAIFKQTVIEIVGMGLPDGMCMDIDGLLWIAEWNGSKVSKWDPESGKKKSEIILPCINVTSCCLGGENLEYLYITTAKNTERYEPMAGGIFRVKLR